MGKVIDLTGQRFGRLVVESRADNIGKRAAWLCKCDCGNIKIVRSDLLRNGGVKSCGCFKHDCGKQMYAKNLASKLSTQNVDLTNHIFGHLTVLSKIENTYSQWLCQCDCGQQKIYYTSELLAGKHQSCGCQCTNIKIDLTNQKFGKLIVLQETTQRGSDGSIIWKCQCDCGSIVYVNGNNLKTGHTQSCGCLKSQGEQIIANLLTQNNIPFVREKTFENCIFENTKQKAKFDFYVNNQYIIEYDGEQHFHPVDYFGGEDDFILLKQHDKIKNQWCLNNNIPIIRIPYNHTIILEDLLLNTTLYQIKE